jgi:rubrerythrin
MRPDHSKIDPDQWAEALTGLRDGLGRLLGAPDGRPAEDRADLIVDNLSRRRFLGVGGLAVVSAAVLAACTTSKSKPPRGGTSPSTTDVETSTTIAVDPDVAILRLASSLEHAVIAVYQSASGLELVTNKKLVDATTYFSSQHADHAGLFQGLTSQRGGQPFTDPNQAILESLQPRLAALATQADVVELLYDVESVAAATYLSVVGTFTDNKLDAVTTSVAGIEGRHFAVLGLALSGLPKPTTGIAPRTGSLPFAASGFQTPDGAVPPGTGV